MVQWLCLPVELKKLYRQLLTWDWVWCYKYLDCSSSSTWFLSTANWSCQSTPPRWFRTRRAMQRFSTLLCGASISSLCVPGQILENINSQCNNRFIFTIQTCCRCQIPHLQLLVVLWDQPLPQPILGKLPTDAVTRKSHNLQSSF